MVDQPTSDAVSSASVSSASSPSAASASAASAPAASAPASDAVCSASSASAASPSPVCVGIDVAKHHLDVCLQPGGQVMRLDNQPQALAWLVELLRRRPVACIAIESTGGYERASLQALTDAGLPVALVNPRPVRDFARAMGLLAKTDRLDARVLADYARRVDPVCRPPAPQHQQDLKELVARRRQLVDAMVVQRNQREHARLQAVRDSIQRMIQHLATEIAAVEALIQRHIDADAAMRKRCDTLQRVRGVGPATARVLVSEMPELGAIGRRELAALAGVAPFNDDSGRRQGPRHIRGGRSAVRCALYMATLVATRHNPVIAAHYQHLKQQGKPRKVALVACMRKLLIHLNAILREQGNP